MTSVLLTALDDGARATCAMDLCRDLAPPGVFELRDVLAVVKTPSHERIAMRWLARSSPDVRAEALINDAISFERTAPHTMAWLADEWLARAGASSSAENNRAVARNVFAGRSEALAAMLRGWADRPRKTAEFHYDRELFPALVMLVSHPAERARVAVALQLPLDELLLALGSRGAAARGARRRRRAERAELVGELLTREPVRAIEIVAARLHADDNLPALRLLLRRLTASMRRPQTRTRWCACGRRR